jgi:hypothetical protein
MYRLELGNMKKSLNSIFTEEKRWCSPVPLCSPLLQTTQQILEFHCSPGSAKPGRLEQTKIQFETLNGLVTL